MRRLSASCDSRPIGPFRLYPTRTARPLHEPPGPQAWRLTHTQAGGGWIPAGVAYSPLCRAEAAGRPVLRRRDAASMLEVEALAGGAQILGYHRTGQAEMAGCVLSIASEILLVIGLVTGRDRSPSAGTTRAID